MTLIVTHLFWQSRWNSHRPEKQETPSQPINNNIFCPLNPSAPTIFDPSISSHGFPFDQRHKRSNHPPAQNATWWSSSFNISGFVFLAKKKSIREITAVGLYVGNHILKYSRFREFSLLSLFSSFPHSLATHCHFRIFSFNWWFQFLAGMILLARSLP